MEHNNEAQVAQILETYSENELVALALMNGLKPSYRNDYFRQEGLGDYNKDNAIIRSLESKGCISINKAGAIVMDRKKTDAIGKAHTMDRFIPGINQTFFFDRKA
jgi:hypothetical protein